jgi:hypothetical protein
LERGATVTFHSIAKKSVPFNIRLAVSDLHQGKRQNIGTKLHLTGWLSAALRLERQAQRKLHIPRILRAGNRAETGGRAKGPTSPDRRV